MSVEDLALQKLKAHFPDDVTPLPSLTGQAVVRTERDANRKVLEFLRDDPDLLFDQLADICGYDGLELPEEGRNDDERLVVVHILRSHRHNALIQTRTYLPEDDPVMDSAWPVFGGADWTEREIFDLYGVRFEGHPNLRRLLMPDDYEGHPLRKDYPLKGRGERDAFYVYSHISDPIAPRTPDGYETDTRTLVEHGAISAGEGGHGESGGGTALKTGPVSHVGVDLEQDKELVNRTVTLNFGPQHPAMHGTLRAVLELDGEDIVRCTPEIGFLHTGFEKLGEYRSWNQFVALSDRMNYFSPLMNNYGFTHAVEEMLELEIPEDGEWFRMILCELTRIADHVISIGLQGMDLGAFTPMLWSFTARERLYDIFENVTGARLTTSFARVGGSAWDPPATFKQQVRDTCEHLEETIDDMWAALARNKIFLVRMTDVGVLDADTCRSWGVTGPIARGAGVDWDLRRDRPYWKYDEVEFDVPTMEDGDLLARFTVRSKEMRESIRIIRQCLERMGDGPFSRDDPAMKLINERGQVFSRMEEMIHHFKMIMHGHGFTPDPGMHYSVTESTNGELGYFLISDGTMQPYRVRVRPPSLINYATLPIQTEGGMISDFVAVMSSINVIAGELDR